ncbi:NPC intracellular cholesterol transporter 2 homolog a [Monomorium pharaonis]|uniref:NPC intracellular cholesterol transporter 2 homolog a n=1 Tax=Monomorium pharaonis TaxID=307658 RepID=UPI00063FA3AB|nr:NPC intracellular cholesterol transporter 2 homolog a [Monomorium pharaonis]
MLRETSLVFAALVVFAGATVVYKCGSETPFEDPTQISISGCDKPECPLKQGTTINVDIKLVPNREIKSLTNAVNAILFGVPLPFVGVDGTNACDNIYNPDGSKAGCPLKPNVEYLYKINFPVLSIYPRVALIVHYALKEGNEEIMCFEAPSKIIK